MGDMVPNIVHRYISAYNSMNTKEMLECLNADIHFKNLSDGIVTAESKGIVGFEKIALSAVNAFSWREQSITNTISVGHRVMVSIDYRAAVAIDLPNGWKSGQRLAFSGSTYFEIENDKIRVLVDAS